MKTRNDMQTPLERNLTQRNDLGLVRINSVIDMPRSVAQRHELWIERFSNRLGVGTWAGALVFDGATAVVFFLVVFLVGAWNSFETFLVYFLLGLLLAAFVFNMLSVYIRNQMNSLEEYSRSMVKEPGLVSDRMSSISSFRAVIIFSIIFNSFVDVPFILYDQGGLPPLQNLIVSTVPWFLGFLPVSTTIWVGGYSLVVIYRLGKLPMKLKPFTEDRILGLRPFASASLRLTFIFYSYVFVQLLVDSATFGVSPGTIARDIALVVLGLVLFLLPLFSIHRKLVQARKEENAWLSERYTQVVERIKSSPKSPLDETVQRELLSIDKMQRDVHLIRTWPFDTGALARLLTIVLSLIAILLSKVVAPLFGLR